MEKSDGNGTLKMFSLKQSFSFNFSSFLPETMKIGDLVTLKNLKTDGFLCAEGILLQDIVVSSDIGVFDDAIFCVHLKRQYSASRELEEFLASGAESTGSRSVKHLQALKVG